MANNTGTFFNVNDNDGIPLVGVSTNGKVMINHLYGNCLIGSTSVTGTAKLQVTGDVSASNILPPTDNTGVVGNTAFTWSNGQFTNLTINDTLNVRNAINLADFDTLRFGADDDVQLFYNGTTNVLNIELESAANQIAITDNGTQRFTFTKSGNIGIGTTNPLQRLQVGTANTLGINTTGTVFVVTSNADVGIGTTNPTSKLYVFGDGRFTGIITATGGFVGGLVGIASTATTALGFSTTASINTTGIITATRFVGGLVGIASTATTALGFSTTASINTSGIITATGGFVGTLVGIASTARNVIGGIASVTQLQVGPGITTVGFITASSLRVSGITTLGITTATNIHVSGVSTFVGESYFSNSIGIGTTNLQVELTVIGSARVGTAATYISIGGNNGRNIEIGAGTTTLDTYIDFGGSSTYTNYSARIIRGSGDGGAFSIINRGGSLRLTTQDASPILFVTSNTPRHRITGDGIFLIGTDTSTAERQVLQVAGINSSVYIGGSVGIGTIISTAKLHIGAATTSAAGGAPLKIGVGTTILATPEVGAIEYDGSYLYHTPNSTSGRAYIPPVYTFRLTDNGSPIGPSNNDVFVTPSSLSLEASSVYKISAFVYFLKTTAGTATWRQFFSNAPTIADGYHYHTPVTGMTAATSVAYTQIQQFFYNQGDTAFAWNPSATNLTTGVNHFYRLEMTVLTNAATNWRLRSTQSAGTITPLAGSYYRIEKVGPSTGSFVA
jgi:hypothetical protein